MKVYSSTEIRNVVIAGHNDTGKTTLVSQLLFNAGAANRLGRIDDGTTVTDFDPDEIARKHSIAAAVANAEWNSVKVNLIDTPGYGIFLMEAKGAMRVADSAAITLSAVTGVEVSTEKVWKFAGEFGLPVVFVATKMDRERASASRTIESLQNRFGKGVIPLQLPIGEEKSFSGVVDLLTMKAWTYTDDASGHYEVGDVPAELADDAKAWREQLVEKVAEGADALMERFFEEGSLSDEEIVEGLRSEIAKREIFPVVFSSPSHNIGGQLILDVFANLLPSPAETAEIAATLEDGNEIRVPRKSDASPTALIFKTISDPFAGQLSIFRVYTGTIKSDTSYFNSTRGHEERVGKLQILLGKQQTPVAELRAGDIGAVAKLKDSHTGDTLCAKDNVLRVSHIVYPESAISFAIEPKSKGDEDKLSNAIARIIEEDPMIRFGRETQTKELLISGQGQLHVEIAIDKLKNKYGVEVILHPPKVPYRETITRPADAHGRHKKQSGGHGQFADCKIKMEPLPRGGDFEFVDEIFGGSIPRQFIPAVEKGIQDARAQGYLAGYPVVDFRVRLHDGQFHTVDSSELAFKIAGALAFKEAMSKAGATLLEPIMHVEVYAPSEYVGDLMGDLTSRRGRMEGMDSDDDAQVIKAVVPMSEMLRYGSTLRSITQGRGSFHMEFSHYEEVPRSLQDKVISEAKKAREEEHA